MRQYDIRQDPPAPMMVGEISNPGLGITQKVEAKLDSGADITAIPDRLIDSLKLLPGGVITVSGFDGKPEERRTYFVAVSLNGLRIPLIEAITTSRSHALIGRDILNGLKVVLNGKELSFDVEDP